MVATQLLVILRGNKPLLLDKMRYTEHPLAKKLKDSPISEYNPKWVKNLPKKIPVNEKKNENQSKKKQQIDWDTF